MSLETADDQIHPVDEPVAIATELDQRPIADERPEMALEGLALLARHAQHANQLARGGWMMDALAHRAEQLISLHVLCSNGM